MVLPDRFLLSIIMWLFLLHAADEAEAGDGQEYGSDDSNYNDPLSSENNTGEPSIASMEPPKRVVRIADPGRIKALMDVAATGGDPCRIVSAGLRVYIQNINRVALVDN
ncbi:hypothetical protein EDD21DRAFT_351883 [Dissophora ornata]|nr:hypothetical protein EDD21DRAFT_351883 [Dissophora ornata]